MTKTELRDLISECVKEQLNESVITEDALTEEALAYEQAEAVCEACISVLDEATKKSAGNIKKEMAAKIGDFFYDLVDDYMDDGMTRAQAEKAAQKATEEKFGIQVATKFDKAQNGGKASGNAFKVIGGKIKAIDPKKAGVAVAATAIVSAGIALGVKKVREAKKAKEEKEKK